MANKIGRASLELHSAFGAGVPCVIRANMRCKRIVALQLEIPHHFIKGIASG
jgi:hypothetical protein